MGTADAERGDALVDGPVGLPLVRAASALRWTRPDLTATLAELALDAAPDAGTWVAAAGWLLHGRTATGDGRETATGLLDGLVRWGDDGVDLVAGPEGARLRVELAGPLRRVGEAAAATALLAAEPGTDPELHADACTARARSAVDDAPERADEALLVAEQAWQVVGCTPGAAAVDLLRSVHRRRTGRPDDAVDAATAGLARLTAGGRRSGGTAADHVAAALTAEWIAGLVEGGRRDVLRDEALPAAARLLATARPGRQVADLRLAVARVTAELDGPDGVLAHLEPAARDAADSDAPELESACLSLLGELHEGAGRLDAALTAVRAAMAAERVDRERSARLRTALVAPGAAWIRRRGGPTAGTDGDASPLAGPRHRSPADPSAATEPTALDEAAPGELDGGPLAGARHLPPEERAAGLHLRAADPLGPAPGDRRQDATADATADAAAEPAAGGRRARRLAAEALADQLRAGLDALGADPADRGSLGGDAFGRSTFGDDATGDDATGGDPAGGDAARDDLPRRDPSGGVDPSRGGDLSYGDPRGDLPRRDPSGGAHPSHSDLFGGALFGADLFADDRRDVDPTWYDAVASEAGHHPDDDRHRGLQETQQDGGADLDPPGPARHGRAARRGAAPGHRDRSADGPRGDVVAARAVDAGRPPRERRGDEVSATSRLVTPEGWTGGSGSLIGDALLRELGHDDELRADERSDRDAGTVDSGSALDAHTARWDGSAWAGRPSDLGDTVVFDALDAGDDRSRGGAQPVRRAADPSDTVRYDRTRDAAGQPEAPYDDLRGPGTRRVGRGTGGSESRRPRGAPANGAEPHGPAANGAEPHGSRGYGSTPYGAGPHGAPPHGSAPYGTAPNGSPNGSATAAARDAAFGRGRPGAPDDRDAAGDAEPGHRGAGRSRPGGPEGPGLGDLLADALAAYRNL